MRSIFINLYILFTIGFSYVSFAQETSYKRVRLNATSTQLQKLSNEGLSIDHGYRKGNTIIVEISNEELAIVEALKVPHEILIEDLEKFYAHQNDGVDIASLTKTFKSNSACNGGSSYAVPANFNLGSYAGFMTYQEMLDNIDSMAAKFPNIIKAKSDFDTIVTIQNRPVYWLKISDNPNSDESEPEMLFTSVHHAREPTSMSEVIFFMWYLLENYATNAEIKYLVDNTELYFVPCLNPDGYLYNEQTNASGGGMWRKNRRANNNGTFGVDLNRNYGYMWGSNVGSSPSPSSDTYRGPAAFSEPETRMMKRFCEDHHFITALNAHTYGNDLIYPWGHQTNALTPDSTLFEKWGKKMVEENGYVSGLGTATIGYYTNGDSDDWMYGEQNTKTKIFSMTPEVGADVTPSGFWPPANQIIGICIDAASMNLMSVRLLTPFAELKELSASNITTNSFYQKYSIERLGYDSTASYQVSIQPLLNVASVGAAINYPNLNLFDTRYDSILVQLNAGLQDGDIIKYVIELNQGAFTYRDTITKIYGSGLITYNNSCNDLNGTNTTGSWGISTVLYHSAPSSITDSPAGNYGDNATSEIVLTDTISLLGITDPELRFWARWNLEADYDYVQVLASEISSNNWSALCGLYTKTGNANQAINEPLYDGSMNTWLEERMSLNNYVGQKIKIKFAITSDANTNYDGFYFDDVTVKVFGDSTVGLKNIAPNNMISIFPNPANQLIQIINNSNSNSLSITNTLGEKVKQISIAKGQNSMINISDLPNGIYLLRSNASACFTKFVKN
jgi:carboxypeptidase T